MHNEILFERLLYKHTESLLNLDITFCFLSFLGKKKKLRLSSKRLIFRKPQHRFYSPHPSTSLPPPKNFISYSKAEIEQPQMFSWKAVSHLSVLSKDKI